MFFTYNLHQALHHKQLYKGSVNFSFFYLVWSGLNTSVTCNMVQTVALAFNIVSLKKEVLILAVLVPLITTTNSKSVKNQMEAKHHYLVKREETCFMLHLKHRSNMKYGLKGGVSL